MAFHVWGGRDAFKRRERAVKASGTEAEGVPQWREKDIE